MIDVDKNSSDHPSKNFSKSSDEDSTSPQKELLNTSHFSTSEDCEIDFIPIEDWLKSSEIDSTDEIFMCLSYLSSQSSSWSSDFLNGFRSHIRNRYDRELLNYDNENCAIFNLDIFESFCEELLIGFKYESSDYSNTKFSTRFLEYFNNLINSDESELFNEDDYRMFEEFIEIMFTIRAAGILCKFRDRNIVEKDNLMLGNGEFAVELSDFVGSFLQELASAWAYIKMDGGSGRDIEF